MKTYIVEVPEVHYQKVRVNADSPEQARQKVSDGEGDYLNNALEYSHTLDNLETWNVDEEQLSA